MAQHFERCVAAVCSIDDSRGSSRGGERRAQGWEVERGWRAEHRQRQGWVVGVRKAIDVMRGRRP